MMGSDQGEIMFEPSAQAQLKQVIAECIDGDKGILDALREEIRPLKVQTKRIQPRVTTSISLVGTDGGNNQLQFDPFLRMLLLRAVAMREARPTARPR